MKSLSLALFKYLVWKLSQCFLKDTKLKHARISGLVISEIDSEISKG